jgi:phenylacetate-CoA ligase
LGSVARFTAILENQITVLCCTPTYALRLAETAAREKIPLDRSRVRKLIVAGEPGGSIPAVRARLEEVWPGARVYDHHGMTETGPVTYQCPARSGVLHVIESAYHAEVVQPADGKPARPGETGELVLTTLARTGSPVLRYKTGDLVKCGVRNGPCECGSYETAFEGGILGRTDDMVVVRGVNVYPSAIEEIVQACGGIAEYRMEVSKKSALAELTLQIEPLAECADTSQLVRKLEATFQTALALRVPVAVVSPGSLPRFEMKAKRWIVRG